MRTPAQSTTAARNQSKNPTKNWYMLCLNFVMTCLAAKPAGAASAIKGWNMTPAANRRTSGTPPKGVPVYWRTGTYGHVALSDGGGYCWSNDISRRGKIDRVKISTIKARWGAVYLGWTTHYVTQAIPGVSTSTPKPAPKPQLPANPNAYPGASAFMIGQSHPSVTRLDKRLVKHGYTRHKSGTKYTPGPVFTSYTRANVAEFQRAQGWSGKDADGYPGAETWRRLFLPPKAKEADPLAALKRISLRDTTGRALPNARPTYVMIHPGGTSAFEAPKSGRNWWGTVSLTIEGLPVGATCQVRFVEVDPKTEKITKGYPISEVVGTSGATFFQLTEAGGYCDAGKRLRVQATVWSDGVKVTNTSTRMFYLD